MIFFFSGFSASAGVLVSLEHECSQARAVSWGHVHVEFPVWYLACGSFSFFCPADRPCLRAAPFCFPASLEAVVSRVSCKLPPGLRKVSFLVNCQEPSVGSEREAHAPLFLYAFFPFFVSNGVVSPVFSLNFLLPFRLEAKGN